MEHNKVLQPQCHFDRICIINTVQALCIFTTSVFALDSCLATKITSFTIFFFFAKCMAFHYLPFVNTGWQLHYLYARPDMWMLYITMWGHIHILTFTWEARPLPCRVSPLLTLHVVQCAVLLPEKKLTDHLSNSGPGASLQNKCPNCMSYLQL